MVVRRPADELIYNGMGVWTFYALFAKDALVEDSWRGVAAHVVPHKTGTE